MGGIVGRYTNRFGYNFLHNYYGYCQNIYIKLKQRVPFKYTLFNYNHIFSYSFFLGRSIKFCNTDLTGALLYKTL